MIAQRETQGRVKKTMMALSLAAVVVAVACDTPAPTQISETPEASLLEVADGVPREAIAEVTGADEQVQPLIIVDGVITSRSISELDALDIERIEVIKGKAAEGLYGARAAGGVIQITTKPGTGEGVALGPLLDELEQKMGKLRK